MFHMIPFNHRNYGEVERTLHNLLKNMNTRNNNYGQSSKRGRLREEEDRYVLQIELPGYKKEEIDIELEDNYLTVKTNIEEDNEEQIKRTGIENFKQTYKLNKINTEDINAEFHEGLLIINLPKKNKESTGDKQTITIN